MNKKIKTHLYQQDLLLKKSALEALMMRNSELQEELIVPNQAVGRIFLWPWPKALHIYLNNFNQAQVLKAAARIPTTDFHVTFTNSRALSMVSNPCSVKSTWIIRPSTQPYWGQFPYRGECIWDDFTGNIKKNDYGKEILNGKAFNSLYLYNHFPMPYLQARNVLQNQ